jgi:hypothetical protein
MAEAEKFFFYRWEAAPSLGVHLHTPEYMAASVTGLRHPCAPPLSTSLRLHSPTSGPAASILKMIAVQTKVSSG